MAGIFEVYGAPAEVVLPRLLGTTLQLAAGDAEMLTRLVEVDPGPNEIPTVMFASWRLNIIQTNRLTNLLLSLLVYIRRL